MSKLLVIDKYVARILMLSFFLPMREQAGVSIATCLYFVLRTFLLKQKVPARNYLLALFIGSPYLLYLLSFPFTPQPYWGTLHSMCEHRASILLMPFAFAIFSVSFSELLIGELLYFVYGCFITCLVANADFFYHYFTDPHYHSLSHVEYRTIFHQFTEVHPTYMGMYLCFAICVLLCETTLNTRRGLLIKYLLLVSLLLFLLALGPKMPIIALAIIAVHFAYTHIRSLLRYKWVLFGLAAVLVGSWFIIPFFNQRMREMILGLNATSSTDNSVYVRKVIWNMDTGLLRHYWLTGTGPGRMLHVLQQHYFFYSLHSFLPVPFFDPHSEYFYEWLSFGLLGIGLLVLVLLMHLRKALATRDYLYLYLLIVLITTFFTESVLSLQRGVLFFTILTSMFFFSRPTPSRS